MCDVSKIIEKLNSYKYSAKHNSKHNSKPITKSCYEQLADDSWTYMKMLDRAEFNKTKGETNEI